MADYDLVVRGGNIADGAGGEPYEGDVAVSDGLIAAVGEVSGSGSEEIDAKGMLVTPGFVDIHTHYDGQITWADRLQPSSIHGVTTVVMGNCAVGFAPCRPDQHDALVTVMEGVEDIPGIVLSEGVPWKWETFPEYLDFLETREADVDFAAQAPHAPIRVYVMGDRGINREPANASEIEQMAGIAAEAIEAGAIGFSTSRSVLHRLKDGRLAPTITAGTDELFGIARAIGKTGKGVLQFFDDYNDGMAEYSVSLNLWRQMCEASGRPASFNLAQNPWWEPGMSDHILEFTHQANADGLHMKAQVCNRPIGALFGLDCSTHPFVFSKSFQPLIDKPLADKVAAMRDPALREKLLAEAVEGPNPALTEWVRKFDGMYPLGDPPNYMPTPADSIEARARAAGADPLEFVYDYLLEDEGRSVLYFPITNFQFKNFDELSRVIAHPDSVQGIADGGAHLGMICDASAPTHLLTHWTRDRTDGPPLPVGWAVKELTRATAEVVGFLDRGLLKPGHIGDVNVIDYDHLTLHAPYAQHDLPAGGRRMMQKADGYVATVKKGQVTYREGEAQGPLPGRLIRGAQPAPA